MVVRSKRVKQPAVRHAISLHRKPCWRKWWSSLFLKEIIVLLCTTKGGSLFHSFTTSLVKKNLVQSRCSCLHLSFTPLLLVCEESSIKKSLLASIFVGPLSISKHYEFSSETSFLEREQVKSCQALLV